MTLVAGRDLTERAFREIARLVHEVAGIHLVESKRELVRARLGKRLAELDLPDFERYVEYVRGDRTGNELLVMIDLLTTNKTSFFREPAHFAFLRETVIPRTRPGRFRVWSAACSSGEEPYSIAIELLEDLRGGGWDPRILATDISPSILALARRGIYRGEQLEDVPGPWRRKYFRPAPEAGADRWSVTPDVRRLVRFARLNLMDPWPMKGPFDVIFCRNVMIYFDKPTQARLVARFHDLLRPGGWLFVGHSESLTNVEHPYEYVQPAIYRRPGGES